MKSAFTVIALALLLTGCSRRDIKLRQQIAGTWTRERPGTITIAPDGTFSMVAPKPDHTDFFAGTWKIKDGAFTMTITNASAAGSPLIGGVESYRILHVDDHRFVYEESGQTHTLTR